MGWWEKSWCQLWEVGSAPWDAPQERKINIVVFHVTLCPESSEPPKTNCSVDRSWHRITPAGAGSSWLTPAGFFPLPPLVQLLPLADSFDSLTTRKAVPGKPAPVLFTLSPPRSPPGLISRRACHLSWISLRKPDSFG